MRSSTIFASVLAFAASTLAQTPGYAVVTAPGKNEVVPAGKTYTIQWSAGQFTGPATISLMGGNDPSTLVVLDPIASVDVEDESFAWKVDCSLGEDKTYGIKITDTASGGATFQYSFPFAIKGPSCDSTTSASSSSSVSASTSASTSVRASSSGYPISSITASTSTTSASAYPTTIANSTTPATKSSSTITVKTNSTTSVKSYTEASSTASTWTTFTTPVVTVTKAPTATASGSTSGTPATSTTASSPLPTAGAARTGAGLALGLIAAVFAL